MRGINENATNYGHFINEVTLFDERQRLLPEEPHTMRSYKIQKELGYNNLKEILDDGMKYKFLNRLERESGITLKELQRRWYSVKS